MLRILRKKRCILNDYDEFKALLIKRYKNFTFYDIDNFEELSVNEVLLYDIIKKSFNWKLLLRLAQFSQEMKRFLN